MTQRVAAILGRDHPAKKKKDYAAESAAQALEAQATAMGLSPEDGSFTTSAAAFEADPDADDDEDSEIATEEELVAA